QVLLRGLTSNTGGRSAVLATGAGSIVDISALVNLSSDQGSAFSTLQATQGGQIKSASLTSLSDVVVTIDGSGTLDTAQIVSLTGATLDVSGGNPSFAALSNINGSTVSVSGGVTLTLAGVTS